MINRSMRLAALILLALIGYGCSPIAPEVTSTPSTEDTAEIPILPTSSLTPFSTGQVTPVFDGTRYAFPKSIDIGKQYLFYLHGKIIEDQGLPAVDPDYGEYEYLPILEKLSAEGFVVISELRPKGADPLWFAQRTAGQVRDLLNAGVPPRNITVVGASKGAYITVLISDIVENNEINYVIMAICDPEVINILKTNHIFLYGNVLSIYDSEDIYAGSCEELFSLSKGAGLNRTDEIVLEIGTGHGILYKPLDEWIDPIVEWARQP